MMLKKGQLQMGKIVWWLFLLVFLIVAGYFIYTFYGEGGGLLDKFFNLF